MPSAPSAVLTAHPSTPCAAIRAFDVRVQVRETDLLVLDYALQGDIARWRMPPNGEARRVDELWNHSCFEAFWVTDDSPGYYELISPPWGGGSAYRFPASREGRGPADGVGVPVTTVLASDTALRVE